MDKKKSQTENDIKERIFDWERDMNSNVRQMSALGLRRQKNTCEFISFLINP